MLSLCILMFLYVVIMYINVSLFTLLYTNVYKCILMFLYSHYYIQRYINVY